MWRPQPIHEEVQQSTGEGLSLGLGSRREDANEPSGDVFGGDVLAEISRCAAGVEDVVIASSSSVRVWPWEISPDV